MNVTIKQLDVTLKEINEIFRKLDARIKALEEAQKPATRKPVAKEDS